jgi:hypothetical protein
MKENVRRRKFNFGASTLGKVVGNERNVLEYSRHGKNRKEAVSNGNN